MENNIDHDDINKIIKFLKKPKLTAGEKVYQFEKWSSKQVKYSVFVNSGSSANFLTLAALKIFK